MEGFLRPERLWTHMSSPCPACGADLVPFADLAADVRDRLETDPARQRQSVDHRRRKHSACPSCELELHGCGQPYAVPEPATR